MAQREGNRVPGMARSFALVLVGALATGGPALAGRIDGGGSTSSDCYVEFDVDGGGPGNRVTCTDGDPSCDTDGTCTGTCTFNVRVCLDQTDLPSCTPKAFKRTPKASPGTFQSLVPNPNGSNAVCGSFGSVPVKVKTRARHKKIPATLKLKVTGLVQGKPKSDKDTLFLTCKPRPAGEACPPPTTTTSPATTTTSLVTTTTASTTTTQQPANTLSFTTTVGTTSCGGPSTTGFTPPTTPFGGEVDDVAPAKLADLGVGCLYIGGGAASVAASLIPDGTTTLFNITSIVGSLATLGPNTGADPASCSKGAGPGKHCANGSAGTGGGACTTDVDCGGLAGSCALDANCLFGPPLPIPNTVIPALSVCVINVIQTNGSGTADQLTGASQTAIDLSSRVYLTGNVTAPCPKCVSSACAGGENDGAACTPVGSLETTRECSPTLNTFQAPIPTNLTPLTTGTASSTAADGLFCEGQTHAGAFHVPTAVTISETGMPSGDVTDGALHPARLGSTFCVGATGNAGVDGLADLPGPGAINLTGNVRVQ